MPVIEEIVEEFQNISINEKINEPIEVLPPTEAENYAADVNNEFSDPLLEEANDNEGVNENELYDEELEKYPLREIRGLDPDKEDEDGANLDDSARNYDEACKHKEEGNSLFSKKQFSEAALQYGEALRKCPREERYALQRAIFYGNRALCHLNLENPDDALYDCDRALELNPSYIKAMSRRATALERLNQIDDALRDLQAWLEREPHNPEAKREEERVKKLISERDEKLKDEMLGKLKDLGNTLLGKFGLSLDNFKAVQDPATGSYSISFQQ